MDFINKIFNFELATMVPDMALVLDKVRLAVTVAVLLGPAFLLILGLIYFFIPPKEANHRLGFRTYFGMGSVEAWKFSQKIAGLAYGGLGAILLLVMFIIVLTFFGKDLFRIANTAIICLLWQVGLTLIARITVGVMCYIYFDKDGNRKKILPKIPAKAQPKYRKPR